MEPRGHNGTHDRSGGDRYDAAALVETSFPHPNDTFFISRGERNIFSRRVEVSRVRDSSSPDIPARRQRGTVISFPDDLQSEGGSGRCVVCLYDPRFVLLHANCSIVTDLEPRRDIHPITIRRRIICVYREATRGRVAGVDVYEERLDGHPSLITGRVWLVNGDEFSGPVPDPTSRCSAYGRYEERERGRQVPTVVGEC